LCLRGVICEAYQLSILASFRFSFPLKLEKKPLKFPLNKSTYCSDKNHAGFRIPLATSIKDVDRYG
jgi:hypothetical protein